MAKFKELLDWLRGGRPFGYVVPILVLFFIAAWWKTGDKTIMDFLQKIFWAVFTGGALALGHHLRNR